MMATKPKGIVRRKRPPAPKTPATRQVVIEALRAIVAIRSEDQAQTDLSYVLQHSREIAALVLADRTDGDADHQQQARRLQRRADELESLVQEGALVDIALCAIDVGAILQDLGAFYIKEGSRTASYGEGHFRRMEELIARGMGKRTAARRVLQETSLRFTLEGHREELENKAGALVQAFDRSLRAPS